MRRSLARAAGLVAVFSFPVSPMGWRGRREEAVGARGESCRRSLFDPKSAPARPPPKVQACPARLRTRLKRRGRFLWLGRCYLSLGAPWDGGGGRAPRGGRGRAWGELSRCAFFGVNTRLQPSPCKRTVRWPPASPGWLRVSFTFGVFTPIRKLRVQLQAWRPMRGARATVVPFTHFRPHYKRERMKFEVGVPISVSVF
jgi:hypothetical protein